MFYVLMFIFYSVSIILQIKTINQPERFEWRLADILEKIVKRIHTDIMKTRIRYNVNESYSVCYIMIFETNNNKQS